MNRLVSACLPSVVFSVVLALFVVAPSAYSETSVWRLEKAGAHLYLGGTIHVLKPSDYPLPGEFDQAFQAAEVLVFEADIERMKEPMIQGLLMGALMYTDGRSLQSVLRPDLYERISVYMQARGLPVLAINMFTAAGISLSATMMELQALGVTESGVDKFYFDLGVKQGKAFDFLETVEQQIQFLAGLGEGIENEMVEYTLNDLDRLSELMDQMTAVWRTGQLETLDKLMVEGLKDEFPTLYKTLFLSRNQAWLPQLEAMAKTEEVEFVLVGAAHLVGEDSLLAQMRTRGYSVKAL